MKLEEILSGTDVVDNIRKNINELFCLIPELRPCVGFDQMHPHHHLDVWEHTLLALSMAPNDFQIRLVLLLHDIGKPFSYQYDGEVRHFAGHAEKSREISSEILKRFDFDKSFVDEVLYLIGEHDTEITIQEVLDNYDLSYKKYIVQKCDALAHNPTKLEKRKKYLEGTKKYFKK